MAYPARNFEKDPSKRTKGWYMVPGKGRRYWDGKAFKFRSPDGTTNLKGLAGSVINRVKDAVKTKPTTGRGGRSRNRGRGSAVRSEEGGRSTAPNPRPDSAQNNPSSQSESKKPAPKPQPKKPQTTTKASTPKKTAYQTARDKIKTAKDKKSATLNADIEGLNSFIKAHGKKPGMAKAIAKAKESLAKKKKRLKERTETKSKAVKSGWPGNKNY